MIQLYSNMKRIVAFCAAFFVFFSIAKANEGYTIKVELSNFEETELYLAYYYGDKQYIKDTVQVSEDGSFTFSGEEALKPGVYLVVMPPENNHFQILIPQDEQHFSVQTDTKDLNGSLKIEGSKDNNLFYNYLDFLAAKRPIAQELNQKKQSGTEEEKIKADEALEQLNQEVKNYQIKLLEEHPKSLTAAIIKANLSPEIPEYSGTEEEIQTKKWRYMQSHYFDNIDLGDPRMLFTPFLFERIDYFIHKLQVQHPDTIAKAIEYVLEGLKPAEESFKFYLVHFLNAYAKSDIVGMDAVYVHLVEKYYATGQAKWTEQEQLDKIIQNAVDLKPLLIGKTAPDIRLKKRDGTQISLHEVASPYTVLYFWRYDCGHCKESTPFMKKFHEAFKDRGVTLFAICAKYTDEEPECWDYIDENEIGDWLHVTDPWNRSKFQKKYNMKSTPQIYILDDKKEIISKRIGAEQLEEVMDKIIEMRNKEEEKG